MEFSRIPTSSEVYLEANGKKIAVVQSYKASASRSGRSIEAFGEKEPVATIEGQRSYKVELTRIYATDGSISDGISFYDLNEFSLVIVKPDRRIVYTGCKWQNIEESGEIGDTMIEKITVIAAKRVETH